MKLKFLEMKIEFLNIKDNLSKLEYEIDCSNQPATEKIEFFQNTLYVIEYRLQILENKILDYQFEQLILSLLEKS